MPYIIFIGQFDKDGFHVVKQEKAPNFPLMSMQKNILYVSLEMWQRFCQMTDLSYFFFTPDNSPRKLPFAITFDFINRVKKASDLQQSTQEMTEFIHVHLQWLSWWSVWAYNECDGPTLIFTPMMEENSL